MAVRHHHLPELQSVRGIAALVVLLHHCLFYFALPQALYPAAETLLNAHAAVIAFFVLSGYVLTLSFTRTAMNQADAVSFLLRRVFRIYPAVWFACGLSLVLLVLLDHEMAVPGQSTWASKYFAAADGGAKSALASFMAYGSYLVPPLWSITAELLGSLLVLVLAISVRGDGRRMALALVLLASVSLFLPQSGRGAVMATYLVHFAIGASIPHWIGLFEKLGIREARIAAAACLVVMAAFRLLGGWNFTEWYSAPVPALAEGIAAAILIALVVTRREAFGWLAARPLVVLGDISYSVYLLHFPIMAAVAIVGGGMLGLAAFGIWPLSALALMLTTLALTLPLALLSYRWVELPGIALGNAALSALRLRPALAQPR
ncbi:acyltransferase family protein [Bosea vaviloviae]|uniref:Acyltransferase 3 domain-containing protein n=1 Tax=Bosea vaviloviae TaxID=1526658 RepID=A0A0N1FJ32_9HYPH|nr:acyltransferase [Bosea vaviloviae]KPH81458.1 hypothetical protein AE618_06730 [Bosea vaviloviae]